MTATTKKPSKPSTQASAPRKPVDWAKLKPHYCAGIRSLKDIGDEFQVSDAAIIKHARKMEWARDLKGKIQAKADAKVSAAMVSAEVSAQTKITEQVTIEVEATVQSRIRLAHRQDIGKLRTLVMHMGNELDVQTVNPDLLKELEALVAGLPKGAKLSAAEGGKKSAVKVSAALEKLLALSTRTTTVKALVEAYSRLVALESDAYGLKAGSLDPEDPLTAMLRGLQGKARTITPVADDPDLTP